MEESSWDVYSGFICIAKECKLEDALMIIEALANKYLLEKALANKHLLESRELLTPSIGIKLHINEGDKTVEERSYYGNV